MIADILNICVVVLAVSFTLLFSVGSLAIVAGIFMVLFNKDVD